MCFSPAVSFAASAGLAIIGVLTLTKIRRRRDILFGAIPLLFAAQQLIEGMLWLVLLRTGSSDAQSHLIQTYVVFAGIIWPTLAPFSLWAMEPNARSRRFMLLVLLIGTGIALYTLNGLIQYGVTAHIAGQCIRYEYPIAQGWLMLVSYVIATCAPFVLSSDRSIQWIGAAHLIAFLLAHRFYHIHFVSVWCLFAAVISGLIYFHFDHKAKHASRLVI